jgi:RNA polymerase sigma-70 factor (ECF subfamily)
VSALAIGAASEGEHRAVSEREQAEPEQPSRREERRLIRAAQRGSGEALEELFRRHWPRAYRSAYMVIRDAGAAEDVAQEAFMAAIRALDRFDRRRPFAPWLQRIAVNKAIDHVRARRVRAEVSVGREPRSEAATATAEAFGAGEEDERGRHLDAALAELSPEHRAIVAMRFVLDLTPGEIAKRLDLPRGTVNSRLRRALDRMAEAIEERGEPATQRPAEAPVSRGEVIEP